MKGGFGSDVCRAQKSSLLSLKEKAERLKTQQLFLDPAQNQGHRANHNLEIWRDR